MHINVSIHDEGVIAMDIIKKLVSRKHLTSVGQQSFENTKFRKGNGDLFISFLEDITINIELVFSKGQ